MTTANSSSRQFPKLEPYGNLTDLYAARAIRARTLVVRDAETTRIVPIGRGSAAAAVRNSSRHIEPTGRRFKFVAASLAVAVFGSWFAHDTFAAPPLHDQQSTSVVVRHSSGPIDR
jgi:hypothetical protein